MSKMKQNMTSHSFKFPHHQQSKQPRDQTHSEPLKDVKKKENINTTGIYDNSKVVTAEEKEETFSKVQKKSIEEPADVECEWDLIQCGDCAVKFIGSLFSSKL